MIKIRVLRESKDAPLNGIQQYNLNFLMNNSEVAADLGELDIYDAEDFVKLVKGISVLGRAKITDYITGKSYGKLFKLSNGRVLKMFAEGIDPASDIDWYAKSLEKLFSGEGASQTLPIFDWGKPKIVSKTVYWGEMAEFTPLDKWLERTGRGGEDITGELNTITDFYMQTQSVKLKDLVTWLEEQMKSFHNPKQIKMHAKLLGKKSDTILTKAEILATLQALQELLAAGQQPKDIFARNIGKIEQSRPDKPVFVIFDN